MRKRNFYNPIYPEDILLLLQPLQNRLWYVVAGNDSGYYVGFCSLFNNESKMDFQYFPRNDSLLGPVADHEGLQKLIRFSQQFYTIEKYNGTLIFNDFRFGQVISWQNPKEQFVFHYFLQHPEDNTLVVQRGRIRDKYQHSEITTILKQLTAAHHNLLKYPAINHAGHFIHQKLLKPILLRFVCSLPSFSLLPF